MRKKQTLEKFIALEKAILKAVKAVNIAHVMECREYLFDMLRIKSLSKVCAELKINYNPTGSTVYDDKATFINWT